MDPNTIIILVGFGSLFIERLFTWMRRIKKSECCGASVEMSSDVSTTEDKSK
jgi:hypothetical protein